MGSAASLTSMSSSPEYAYFNDIPGTRVDPTDEWPKKYTPLSDSKIWSELGRTAKPRSDLLPGTSKRIDGVNFQPSYNTSTQDRYVVQALPVNGEEWTMTAVFDGHLGDATVEHAAYHMPIIVRDNLRKMLLTTTTPWTPSDISEMLTRSVTEFDDAIANDVLELFPGGIEGLSQYSDKHIQRVINDQQRGGVNFKKARLCMYGTTALVALMDPSGQHLWLANLGDCQAVVVSETPNTEWTVEALTVNQNGDNQDEVARVRAEHPGEPYCVTDQRVLGAIAPFRCIGDTPFKQPPEFTRRILYNLFPGFRDVSPWEEFLQINHTPPYISSTPEITYRFFPTAEKIGRRYLVLTSDGFTDLCQTRGQQSIFTTWASNLRLLPQPSFLHNALFKQNDRNPETNLAMRLLREAIGGRDTRSVSKVLTLDSHLSWIDDTCIVVQTF